MRTSLLHWTCTAALLVACGGSEGSDGGGGTSGSAGTAGADAGTDATIDSPTADSAPEANPEASNEASLIDAAPDSLHVLEGYLLGDFDNADQVAGGFSKLVERHVCSIPGREDPAVLWLYVEHVEVLANGDRDSYFTRVNEVRMDGDAIVSRAYKFDTGHPLYSNAYEYNGPIDGCSQAAVLEAIADSDLLYRDGCDVTFVHDGDVFHATTEEGTCTFPGGYITTSAEVFADGMDVTDLAYQGGGTPVGDTYEFRRVQN